MLLTGTFVRAIDEKLRLAIPKRLRDALGAGPERILFVTPGTDRSLAIYTEESLGKLGQRLAAASPAGPEVRAFSRLFYAQAQPADQLRHAEQSIVRLDVQQPLPRRRRMRRRNAPKSPVTQFHF